MDKHTFIGKRKVGSTEICDFTDYQGIGKDPLYKRYDSVYSVVKKVINPQFAHFLSIPDYSAAEDAINWYIDQWKEIPEILSQLVGDKKEKYQRIKTQTIDHYKASLEHLSGEELQVMACALRYVDDDFIFCADDKVFVIAWGMTPDERKHISRGELVHEAPLVNKFRITFDVGNNGSLTSKFSSSSLLTEGSEITPNDLPEVIPNEGFVFAGWEPYPLGLRVTSDMNFVAKYDEIKTAPAVEPPLPPQLPPTPQLPELPEATYAKCYFNAGDKGILKGSSEITKEVGECLSPSEIPVVKPIKKKYKFKGWNVNPVNYQVLGDTTFEAEYEVKKKSRHWLWGKWLLWLLLLLLLLLLLWLLKDCKGGCSRGVDLGNINGGGVEWPKVEDPDTDGDYDFPDHTEGSISPMPDPGRPGYRLPITPPGNPGVLPPEPPYVVAPIDSETPVIKGPNRPPVVGNRLILFLENDNDKIEALASDFKKAYPDEKYSIIGFDRDVKSLVIQVPEEEREQIRDELNARIPNHEFIVFDEQILELSGYPSEASNVDPGWHLQAVNASKGWNITKGSPNVKVAVIDDGLDMSHPIFKGRIINPYNVFTQDGNVTKGGGHGTHTAGLAVGSLNYLDQGAAGIAPECMLIPIQVFGKDGCPLSALVSGIMYAIHKDADVVNISIGPAFPGLNSIPVDQQEEMANTEFKNDEKLWERICNLAAKNNTILVFAAGNDGILSKIPPENRTNVAITVGAVDNRLYQTDFTNFGLGTDISAPGKDIYSSYPTSDFKTCDGTSMAAPIVTGAIALMKSLKKDLTVEQARNVLYKTGADVYGDIPPMVKVDLALEAVKRGDFSRGPERKMRPIPSGDGEGGEIPDPTPTPDPSPDPSYEDINNLLLLKKIYQAKIDDLDKRISSIQK